MYICTLQANRHLFSKSEIYIYIYIMNIHRCRCTTQTDIHSMYSIIASPDSTLELHISPTYQQPILLSIHHFVRFQELAVSQVVSTWICWLYHKIWWNVQWTQQHRGLKHWWCQGRLGSWKGGWLWGWGHSMKGNGLVLVAMIEDRILIPVFFSKTHCVFWYPLWN